MIYHQNTKLQIANLRSLRLKERLLDFCEEYHIFQICAFNTFLNCKGQFHFEVDAVASIYAQFEVGSSLFIDWFWLHAELLLYVSGHIIY